MIAVLSGAPMADPTKLVQAEGACHVVAAFNPFDSCLAHGAEAHVFLVPIIVLIEFIHVLLACQTWMVLVFAVEANSGFADITL